MAEPNPYAAPQVAAHPLENESLGDGRYRRHNDLLAVEYGAELPDRCIHCNHPASGRRWRYGSLWIAAPQRRFQKVRFEYGVCSTHATLRRLRLAAVFAMIAPAGCYTLLSMLDNRPRFGGRLFFFGIDSSRVFEHYDFVLMAVAIPAAIAMYVLTLLGAPVPLTVLRVHRGRAWVRHVREPFLESLQEHSDVDSQSIYAGDTLCRRFGRFVGRTRRAVSHGLKRTH
jgi:hypothetical protein